MNPDRAASVGRHPANGCRFAAIPTHACANRDGVAPPRPNTICHAEASAQVADLAAARQRVSALLAEQDARAAVLSASEEANRRWFEEREDASVGDVS